MWGGWIFLWTYQVNSMDSSKVKILWRECSAISAFCIHSQSTNKHLKDDKNISISISPNSSCSFSPSSYYPYPLTQCDHEQSFIKFFALHFRRIKSLDFYICGPADPSSKRPIQCLPIPTNTTVEQRNNNNSLVQHIHRISLFARLRSQSICFYCCEPWKMDWLTCSLS